MFVIFINTQSVMVQVLSETMQCEQGLLHPDTYGMKYSSSPGACPYQSLQHSRGVSLCTMLE